MSAAHWTKPNTLGNCSTRACTRSICCNVALTQLRRFRSSSISVLSPSFLLWGPLGPFGNDPTLVFIVLLWKGTEAKQFGNTKTVYKKGETENTRGNNVPRDINTPELTSDSPTGQSRQIGLSYRHVLNIEFWLAVVELVQEPSANNVGEIIVPV